MGATAESRVGGIIKSLSELEDDLDALNSKAADMRKSLSTRAQSEIDRLLVEVRKMATAEAETIIDDARAAAKLQAKKIAQDGEKRLEQMRSKIDANFDDAVKYVVSTVLAP